jgi:hypothetical protein
MAGAVAHFYLILLTVDLLRRSRNPRLVVVSSLLLRTGRLDLSRVSEAAATPPPAVRNPPEYANSKLMNALTVRAVQKR